MLATLTTVNVAVIHKWTVHIPQDKTLVQVLAGHAHFLLPTILHQHPENDEKIYQLHCLKENACKFLC